MTKEQLEKGNKLTSEITETKSALFIAQCDAPIKIRKVQITTSVSGCRDNYINTQFNLDNSIYRADGIYGSGFLARAEMLANGYVESMIQLLKDQLNSLENQLKEL